jgi:hypothetical protein
LEEVTQLDRYEVQQRSARGVWETVETYTRPGDALTRSERLNQEREQEEPQHSWLRFRAVDMENGRILEWGTAQVDPRGPYVYFLVSPRGFANEVQLYPVANPDADEFAEILEARWGGVPTAKYNRIDREAAQRTMVRLTDGLSFRERVRAAAEMLAEWRAPVDQGAPTNGDEL